jgi:hypothetical protein
VVHAQIDLANPMERLFWTAPTCFEATDLSDHEPDQDDCLMAFRYLAELRRLDWDQMHRNINTMLESHSQITLPDLLEAYSPKGGAIEVLGYIQIAHDDGHEVDETRTFSIRLSTISETHMPKTGDDLSDGGANLPDTNLPDTNFPDTNSPETNSPETNSTNTNISATDHWYEIPRVTFLRPQLRMLREGLQTGAANR